MKLLVMKRNADNIIDDSTSLIKTIVIGRNVSLAILNQINENDQKIIDRITAPYVTENLFNF